LKDNFTTYWTCEIEFYPFLQAFRMEDVLLVAAELDDGVTGDVLVLPP